MESKQTIDQNQFFDQLKALMALGLQQLEKNQEQVQQKKQQQEEEKQNGEYDRKIMIKRERAQKSLGKFDNTCQASVKALQNPEQFFELLRDPLPGDWLYNNFHSGQEFDNYNAKKISDNRKTLYIQPIVYKNNSKITDKILDSLKKWLEAFYQPCKVVILKRIYDDQFKGKSIDTQINGFQKTQYNAIHILKNIVGPIQKSKPDGIGVISFTDVDLFTKDLSNFCFGYGIPAYGGVQSIHRFMPEWTGENYESEEQFESKLLLRIIKIATHEIGHMFNLKHCIYYQCLMMGTNHLEQTDRNPIYFCPVCYRKLRKCLGFDHVKRYKDLTDQCKQFKGAFQESQQFEPQQQSYQDFFEKRYLYLKDKITKEDYQEDNQNLSPKFLGPQNQRSVMNNNKNLIINKQITQPQNKKVQITKKSTVQFSSNQTQKNGSAMDSINKIINDYSGMEL